MPGHLDIIDGVMKEHTHIILRDLQLPFLLLLRLFCLVLHAEQKTPKSIFQPPHPDSLGVNKHDKLLTCKNKGPVAVMCIFMNGFTRFTRQLSPFTSSSPCTPGGATRGMEKHSTQTSTGVTQLCHTVSSSLNALAFLLCYLLLGRYVSLLVFPVVAAGGELVVAVR
jgi:hypothetical protein